MTSSPAPDVQAVFGAVRVAIVHAKRAVNDQKQLVLVGMMMPHEIAQEFDQFDVLAVQLANDPWFPGLCKRGQCVV